MLNWFSIKALICQEPILKAFKQEDRQLETIHVTKIIITLMTPKIHKRKALYL